MLSVVIASGVVFSGIIVSLTGLLLFAVNKLVAQGDVSILVNEEKNVTAKPGTTLLSALAQENIFVPSACGGGGTCAMCKCWVLEGGGDILPTEKTHISRKEAKEHLRLACQVKIRQDMKIKVPEEIFSIKQFSATVKSNENVSTFIKYLNMDIDNNQILNFKAGGYIQINVPSGTYKFKDFHIEDQYKEEWDKHNLWRHEAKVPPNIFRAYSMANHPAEGNRVALTIRIAPPPATIKDAEAGFCSSYVFSLKPGDKVNFSGPYGEFFIKDTNKEMVYIGGGAGMAPMRSHLFHLFHTLKTNRKVSFFYGARSLRENFLAEEFIDIQNKFSNFKYVLALSEPQPQDNWSGPTGFIHQVALNTYLKNHEDPTEIEYYLCGPPMMVDSVVKMLHELGVDDEMIAFDAF
jgi:Na+-transporting NADH:ubiquinone oxidoreductase subunit F